MAESNNQYSEARAIAKKMAPFSRGSFTVGGVAYDPNAVRDKVELEVISVVSDFRNADFAAIEKALGRKLNPAAVKLASEGWTDVFDTHYKADGGFDVGVYLRSGEAHESVCNLRNYRRFTDRPGTPRSCNVRSLEGDEMELGESVKAEGGRIYTHYSVAEKDGKIWLGFPALNILMTPTILTGGGALQSTFDTFNTNLKAKILKNYGVTTGASLKSRGVSLVNCIPPHFVERVPAELKARLEKFLD